VPPVYTREAMEQRVQGTMLLKCTITVEGFVKNCRIIKGLPYLNEAVLAPCNNGGTSPSSSKENRSPSTT
jgi:TonB family protein